MEMTGMDDYPGISYFVIEVIVFATKTSRVAVLCFADTLSMRE